MVVTATIASGFTLLSMLTEKDFTVIGQSVLGLTMVMAIFFVLVYVLKQTQMRAVFYCLYSLLFTVYFIYDTQLIIGKHKRKYKIDDYIMASMNIFIDLVQIFLSLIEMLLG
jgi:FtsH-binding integral membrane protein